MRNVQGESKSSPEVFWHFFLNGWEFFDQILHAWYTFLSTIDYAFFIQLTATTILSATTQFRTGQFTS